MALNATINVTSTTIPELFGSPVITSWISFFIAKIWPRVLNLVLAPIRSPDMLWIVAPLFIAFILMQLYFAYHVTEKLGWNTAFGNSIALIFVSVNLMRHLYLNFGILGITIFGSGLLKALIVIGLFLIGLIQMFLDFLHWFPEKLTFFLQSSLPVNLLAYVAIVVVYSDEVPIDRYTAMAGLAIFVILFAFTMLLKIMIPKSKEAREELKRLKFEKKKKRMSKMKSKKR